MNILAVLDYNTFTDDYLMIAKNVESSITYLWFRIKNLDDNFIYNKAKVLRDNISQCKIILSENISIASALQFDGVHLNSRTIPVDEVKKIDESLIIGYSAHSVDELKNINADYFTLSPILKGKFENQPVLDIDKITIDKDVYALGGIRLKDYYQLIDKGFYGIAGVSIISELYNNKTI